MQNNTLELPPIGLGTWAIGGLHWGGTDENASAAAIRTSVTHGVTLIDTAPIYGFGRAEEIVGSTIASAKLRDKVLLATKCGLEWNNDKRHVRRNSSAQWIQQEVVQSLRRLQTDVIDLYQIHWPDPETPFEASMETLTKLQQDGKVRAIGVSNFSVEQMKQCLAVGALREAPLHTSQPPYNLFERDAEKEILPFCAENGIQTLTYGSLCRGLLSGRITRDTEFPVGDLRRADPKCKADRRPQYLKAVEQLQKLAAAHGCRVGQLAIAWATQQPGVTCALVGARNAKQAEENAGAAQIKLSSTDLETIDRILVRYIKTPIGPEFFAPRE